MKLRGSSRVIGLCTVGVLVAGVLVMASAPPSLADPGGRNAAAQFALNVPSSVLSSITGNSTGDALLANGQSFDWNFLDSRYQQVSGSYTASPLDAAAALSSDDRVAFEAASAKFDAPVTPTVPPTKNVGGVVVALSPLVMLGIALGLVKVKVVGYDGKSTCTDSDVGLVSTLDGTPCGNGNGIADSSKNIDQVMVPSDPPRVCSAGSCIIYSGRYAYGGAMYYCFGASNFYQGPPNDRVVYGIDAIHTDASTVAGGSNEEQGCYSRGLGSYRSVVDYSGKAPSAARVSFYNSNGQFVETQILDISQQLEGPNPSRYWLCQITDTAGRTYAESSATFTEKDPALPPYACPVVPRGAIAAHIKITEIGGSVDTPIFDVDTTQAYRKWGGLFPECANGSCLLDLRQNGTSCFAFTADCVNWATDPNRDSAYSCYYGTHQVSLTECYVYGVLFSHAGWPDGHAYADPQTGGNVGQTVPTVEDNIVSHLIQKKRVRGDGDLATDAHTVARQCIALNIANQCKRDDMPIFAPGGDVKEATHHDLIAITGSPGTEDVTNLLPPRPAILTYTATPNTQERWYRGFYPCNASYESDENCDEYPYLSSEEGGLDGEGLPQASLQVINKEQNQLEGSWLGAFYGACGLLGSSGSKFAVVPVDVDKSVFRTSAWCPER